MRDEFLPSPGSSFPPDSPAASRSSSGTMTLAYRRIGHAAVGSPPRRIAASGTGLGRVPACGPKPVIGTGTQAMRAHPVLDPEKPSAPRRCMRARQTLERGCSQSRHWRQTRRRVARRGLPTVARAGVKALTPWFPFSRATTTARARGRHGVVSRASDRRGHQGDGLHGAGGAAGSAAHAVHSGDLGRGAAVLRGHDPDRIVTAGIHAGAAHRAGVGDTATLDGRPV